MTRSIPTKLGLGALLIAFGCNEVFVLGDVVDSTGGPGEFGGSAGAGGGEFGGSGGSGGSDDDAVCAVDGALECTADNVLRRCVDGRSRWDTVLECPVGTTCSNDATLADPCLIERPATPVGGAGGTSVGGAGGTSVGGAGGTSVGGAGGTSVGGAGGTSVGGGDTTSVGDGGGVSASGDTGAAGATTCEPGPPPQTEARCCSTGTRTREYRFDADTCMYITSKWSACSVSKECAAGSVEVEILHCTNGRWRERTRTCGDTCELGEWVEGECQGDPDACTGCACVNWCTDPDTGGTTCLWIGCTEVEARAECEQDIAALCGTPRDPFTFLEWLPN